jgi:hypothetical protein
VIKLYNSSKLPEEPLRQLLTEAKALAGAKGDVVVRVMGPSYGATSEAKRARAVRKAWLQGKRNWYDRGLKLMICTDGGYVIMRPHHHMRIDPLWAAEQFWETAIHEFAHIVQFQSDKFINGQFARFAYSMEWKRRPHELDAVNRTDAALARLAKQKARKARIDDLIIELAIQMEASK